MLLESLQKWDDALFLWVNNRWESPILDPLMLVGTALGNGGYLYPLGIALMLIFSRTTMMRDCILWTVASLAGLLAEGSLKHLVARPRPLEHFSSAIRRHDIHVHVLGPHLHWFSFPSGHATTAFCAAVLFGGLYPKLAVPAVFLASLTGVSRIYVGAHFPSDVLGGAFIGTLSGWFALRFVWPRLPEKWGGIRPVAKHPRENNNESFKNAAP